MLYLCGSLEGREPCPGIHGRAVAGKACPQKSEKVSCSPDAELKPEASLAVLISYTHNSFRAETQLHNWIKFAFLI